MDRIDTTDHDDWLAGIRQRLSTTCDEYRAQLLELGDQTPDAADADFHAAMRATIRQNLADTVAALSRIDAGSYGVCEECGDPIPPERLEILPHARLCVSCGRRR